jgi:hypothetical protein
MRIVKRARNKATVMWKEKERKCWQRLRIARENAGIAPLVGDK